MALKDLIALGDPKLADVFKTPVYDPAKDRAKALDRLAKAEQHYKDGGTGKGIKYVRIANNVAHFNLGFEVPGWAPYVPAERGKDVFPALRTAINAGELDKELKAWGAGTVTVYDGQSVSQLKNLRAASDKPKRETSSTRGDAMRASWAKRKAAKEAEAQGKVIPTSQGGTDGADNSTSGEAQAAPAKATGRKMAR